LSSAAKGGTHSGLSGTIASRIAFLKEQLDMTLEIPRPVLAGRKALVVGVANETSIATGCARAFHDESRRVRLGFNP